ncbi:serine/threonine protein kinase [Massilia violaceinigra]|uniref:Serine/threonine protein kinase n=1 Tax=Massilia violaceinigra TaxID=2045208 RepID=A0A2D2DKF3_9BURK|nr:serine/threonine protein kinase [Massilia violaceinigra]
MEAVLNRLGRQAAYHVGELSEIASARRAGNTLARQLGFDETRAGQLAIVITEAATNIVKHAREGEILLRALHAGERAGVEVIALDRGPGMANVALRMEDGNSTAGTYGVGLGAIGRLTPEFDIYSVEGQGTVLRMTVWSGAAGAPVSDWEAGAVCLPMPGEDVCGDAWDFGFAKWGLTFGMADGLGHGPEAAVASEAAVALVVDRAAVGVSELMQLAHGALHGTRGAAVALAAIDCDAGELTFAGIGNIAGCIFDGSARRHLMSHNGIVGSNLRKVQTFTHPWAPGAMLIMHSDGLGTRWDLDAYPGLAFRHPGLIAAVLYRDFARQRDDASVLVVRERELG